MATSSTALFQPKRIGEAGGAVNHPGKEHSYSSYASQNSQLPPMGVLGGLGVMGVGVMGGSNLVEDDYPLGCRFALHAGNHLELH